jgi:hypothetical protein
MIGKVTWKISSRFIPFVHYLELKKLSRVVCANRIGTIAVLSLLLLLLLLFGLWAVKFAHKQMRNVLNGTELAYYCEDDTPNGPRSVLQ